MEEMNKHLCFWFGVHLNEARGYKNGLGYFSNQNPSALQQEQSFTIICDPKAIVLAGGKSKVELFPKWGLEIHVVIGKIEKICLNSFWTILPTTQTFSGQPRNKGGLMTVFLHHQEWGEHLISLDYLGPYSKKESVTFLCNVIDWRNDLIIQSVSWGWLLWSAFYFPGSLRSDTCYAKS